MNYIDSLKIINLSKNHRFIKKSQINPELVNQHRLVPNPDLETHDF